VTLAEKTTPFFALRVHAKSVGANCLGMSMLAGKMEVTVPQNALNKLEVLLLP
jgi:hypothetical protein